MLHYIELDNYPIYDQLLLEESLLRSDKRSFCIFNSGCSPAVVLGICSAVEKTVDIKKAQLLKIPLIRRFSGGGVVLVDRSTLFISFILNREDILIDPLPSAILLWTKEFYKKAFSLNGFDLKEQDYTIWNKKCAGNAQYISQDRFVHHSSFLWDYNEEHMDILFLPEKMPAYRNKREHKAFITTLKPFGSKNYFKKALIKQLQKDFRLQKIALNKIAGICNNAHRISTTFIDQIHKNYR